MHFETVFSVVTLTALLIAAAIGGCVFIVLYSGGVRDGAPACGIITAAVFFALLPLRTRRPERRSRRKRRRKIDPTGTSDGQDV
jgi:hypothetical protein